MAGRSTLSELLSCYDDWTKWRDGKKPTDIAFLDFSTPFDSVPQERLLLSKSVNWHWRLSSSVVSDLFNWPHAPIRPAWYMLVLVSYFIGSTPGNNSRTVGISVICFLLKPTAIIGGHILLRGRGHQNGCYFGNLFIVSNLCLADTWANPERGTFFRLQGRDFTRWGIHVRKGREICHLGLWEGPKR